MLLSDEKNGGLGLPDSSSAALTPLGIDDSSSDNTSSGKRSFDPKGLAMNYARDVGRRACTKKQLYRKVPILEWAPKYNMDWFVSDMIAGITVGLTVIPQGIAYAIVAGLPPQVNKGLTPSRVAI